MAIQAYATDESCTHRCRLYRLFETKGFVESADSELQIFLVDDNGNLDPRIVLTRPIDGRIDIWIGTYDGEYCNAQLQMETFDK